MDIDGGVAGGPHIVLGQENAHSNDEARSHDRGLHHRTCLDSHNLLPHPGLARWRSIARVRKEIMRIKTRSMIQASIMTAGLVVGVGVLLAQDNMRPSSYAPVDIHEAFATIMTRMSAAKADIMKRQMTLLEERYDLSNNPALGVTMSRSKPIQQGVRVKLAPGVTWDQLAKLTPDQIKARDIFPAGFLPLPHPNHPEGGMVFPKFEIDEMNKQENRDLTRFDLDFDIPD